MYKDVHRCIGQIVEMIYIDRHGEMSQRRVKLYSINGKHVHAFCFEKRSIRSFLIESILAVELAVNRRAE